VRAGKPGVNPHLNYADTAAYGYLVVRFSSDETEVGYVVIPPPTQDYGKQGPPVERRVRITVRAWESGGPRFENITIDGTPPLLGIKT
jgi:hypothetical protein